MKIKNIMSQRVQTIMLEASMHEAHQLMKGLSIRHLPVIDQTGQFVGILSDRDIQRSMTVTNNGQSREYHIQSHKKVIDFMTSEVHYVDEDQLIEKIAREMLEMKLSCFLVRTQEGEVNGIVTTDDLLIYLLDLISEKKSPFSIKNFFGN